MDKLVFWRALYAIMASPFKFKLPYEKKSSMKGFLILIAFSSIIIAR